jgi:hypothetical protein
MAIPTTYLNSLTQRPTSHSKPSTKCHTAHGTKVPRLYAPAATHCRRFRMRAHSQPAKLGVSPELNRTPSVHMPTQKPLSPSNAAAHTQHQRHTSSRLGSRPGTLLRNTHACIAETWPGASDPVANPAWHIQSTCEPPLPQQSIIHKSPYYIRHLVPETRQQNWEHEG